MNKQQLKLRELKIISVIAASENISHAALALGIAQANVSKYLADFESKIGLKVFDRTTRQLTLTPFGAALLPYINTCLDKNNQLTNFIADYKHEKRGRVTLYAPTGITSYLSKNIIANITDIGDITLILKTSNLERKAFYEGVDFPDDCDIMVTYAPPKDQTLVASFLAKYTVSAYASREYLKKHPINHPDELENHSCILIDSMMIDDTNIWRFASNGGGDIHEYRVKGNYVCDNTQAALDLARNHLGIVFAPDTSLKQDIQSGTLIPCFPEQHQWWLDLVVIFRKREYQPWRVQYVLDELLNEIRHELAHVIQKSPEQACQLTDQ
ncbi:LysR family transcriptional regulator [Citrobacter sp. NCU1]|uniref:LysR family transcriptional regulator n=1 Tax=Citrobacter sp. NCU1 TaxID=2026683 RepID=UPI001390FECC|nr:LysR family transcriptional regulator [Citrobacter sp. NCU1]NDO82410.1 LysR family transcriptional regulator [Citrobacter sp. NCU1]